MQKDLIPVRKEDMEDNDKPPVKEITYEVEHDPVGQKFFIHLGNVEAIIAYTQVNDILDLHRTIVPENYRGMGLAEKMSVFVFEFAKKNGYKIVPTCPYISQKFLPDHPEYSSLITSY